VKKKRNHLPESMVLESLQSLAGVNKIVVSLSFFNRLVKFGLKIQDLF